jgi:hypothetical protein
MKQKKCELHANFLRGGQYAYHGKCQITVIILILPLTKTSQSLPGDAITVHHKSQGLPLPKAGIGLGNKEFFSGLSFVAISRVGALRNEYSSICSHSKGSNEPRTVEDCLRERMKRRDWSL